MAVLQNVVGAAVAAGLGQPPLLGVLAGSVTLTGGPATGLAFAPLFQQAGVPGAASVAVMAAMVGIVCGGLIGTPIATMSDRARPRGAACQAGRHASRASAGDAVVEAQVAEPAAAAPAGEDVEAYVLLKHLVVMLVAMLLGGYVSVAIASRAGRCRPTSARCWSPP